MAIKLKADKWIFTTIFEPMYGAHPVSGNREFSYITNPNGSYTFYTKGVDRLINWSAQFMEDLAGIPTLAADGLWESFQSRINAFVQSHGGTSMIEERIVLRPD